MSTCCDPTAEADLYIGADARVYYEGATVDGGTTYLSGGTVTYALKDGAGTVLATGSLTYDGGGTGDYYGVILSTVTALLAEDSVYYVEITYTDGAGNDDFRRLKYTAEYRGAT